jgi:ribosomal protein RSM22 (predicted rRNA methylase)
VIAPGLPVELKAALDAKLHGLSRSDAAARSAAISQTYRSGGGSAAIRSESDALAYALARMPATYAAVSACFNALREGRADFAPNSLLDVGAGPGTATWAAAGAFASLDRFTAIDGNGALRRLAVDLFGHSARFSTVHYTLGDGRATLANAKAADLVIASYLIGEMNDAGRSALTDLMWSKTRDTLVVVEPGTPTGYARIIALRAQLISSGAHVAAPCPHEDACPLTPPDWCHFAQRLPRSRAHMALKQAELPFEDEKFSYVILTRASVTRPRARVLAQPEKGKVAVMAKLCTTDGLVVASIPRRAKADYARARRWRWGDAVK